jgi:hypothetical protein
MKSLLFWAGGSTSVARRRVDEGARVVLWNDGREADLRATGVAFRPAASYLEPGGRERIEEAAIAWTKAWGQRPLADGRSLRELVEWKGLSLWWWAELYLHHSTDATRWVRLVELLTRIFEAEAPDEVEACGLPADEELLLARTCTAWRVLFHGAARSRAAGRRWRTWRVSFESRLNTLKAGVAALKATLLRRPPLPRGGDERRTVLFLSHAAFWRDRRDPGTGDVHAFEHYFDRLIPETDAHPELRAHVVAVGPRAAFRRRGVPQRVSDWLRLNPDSARYVHLNRYTTLRVFAELRRATRSARAAWKRLRHAAGLRESFSHSGVNFADLAAPDLAATLLLQMPWAVRSFEESAEALAHVRPAALCLYAESSGWGRAALAAARAAGVPSVGVQHGILYPTYYSYIHAPDERYCPRPDRTAVFGEAARRFLVERGSYAPESLVVTGSPKFDDLLKAAATWDRAALRARYGVGEGQKLAVLASRFRAIRATHQAVGSAFPALVRAVERIDGLRCVVKPHPAEPSAPYEAAIREAGAARVTLLAPSADLMELMFAADALITVESLSAVEALVLDRPVLVLNMPTNLRELVEAGAALGVPEGADPEPALHALLFDQQAASRLAEGRARHRADVAGGLDGHATRRIVELLATEAGRTLP